MEKKHRKNDHGQQKHHPSPQKVTECRFVLALNSAVHVAPRKIDCLTANIPNPSCSWQRENEPANLDENSMTTLQLPFRKLCGNIE